MTPRQRRATPAAWLCAASPEPPRARGLKGGPLGLTQAPPAGSRAIPCGRAPAHCAHGVPARRNELLGDAGGDRASDSVAGAWCRRGAVERGTTWSQSRQVMSSRG